MFEHWNSMTMIKIKISKTQLDLVISLKATSLLFTIDKKSLP